MWELLLCYDTEELTTPRFYVSLYTQTMRPPSVSLTFNIQSQTKAPFILGSCSASWYWIMNLKGNLWITKLTVFIIWNQTVPGHLDFSVICIRTMLSTAMANVLIMYIYKLKEKKMKVFMRKTEQPCSVNKGASYRINAGHHRPVLSCWNSQLPPGCMVNRSEWVQITMSKTCPNTPVALMNHMLGKTAHST